MERVLLRALAAFFALLSGACYSLLAEVDTVSCDRGTGVCAVTQAGVFRTSALSFPVADLTGAALRPLPGPRGRSTIVPLRLVFLTRQEPVPFMGYATTLGMPALEAQLNAVTRYVATPSVPRLELKHDNRFTTLLMALLPLAASAGLLLLGRRTRTGPP